MTPFCFKRGMDEIGRCQEGEGRWTRCRDLVAVIPAFPVGELICVHDSYAVTALGVSSAPTSLPFNVRCTTNHSRFPRR